MTKAIRVIVRVGALVSFVLLCSMCTSIEEQGVRRADDQGQVTVFLNGPDKAVQDISFELLTIRIAGEDGVTHEIMDQPLALRSFDVRNRQVFLGEQFLTKGKYTTLHLAVDKASVSRKKRMASLALPEKEIRIPVDIEVNAAQNTTVFLVWHADASIVDGFQFNPVMTVQGEVPQVNSLLVYVTNEGSDNVSVINRQLQEVVGTVMVGREPRGVATGTLRDRRKVYVANSGSDSISVIDATTGKAESEIPIRHGATPVDIAVLKIAPNNELLFVANKTSHTVSVIELLSLLEIEWINVGTGPVAIAVDPPLEAFLGSSSLSADDINIIRNFRENFAHVYVVNQNSNDVTVITYDIIGKRVRDIAQLRVEWRPVALTVDPRQAKVIVVNNNSENISVIDIVEVIKGNVSGAVDTIMNIGYSHTGAVTDPIFERIYLTKENPGETVIVKTFSGDRGVDVRSSFPPVIGRIPLGGSPLSLLIDTDARNIYVVNRALEHVSVIDKSTNKEVKTIPVGKKPYDIAIDPF